MLRAPVIRRSVVLALAAGASLCIAGSAIAVAAPSLAQEEQQGRSIAESVRSGERQCSDLSTDEFELIGEYAMGRYLGSEATHSAMNRRMTLMMGEAGERRMHVALGCRYSGCSGGPGSGWVGPMAGMMGGGGYGAGSNYSGTMMGSGLHSDSGMSALGVVLIALAAAAAGAVVATLVAQRRAPSEQQRG